MNTADMDSDTTSTTTIRFIHDYIPKLEWCVREGEEITLTKHVATIGYCTRPTSRVAQSQENRPVADEQMDSLLQRR
eukprot:scaffold4099_cov73-Skeletonema_dohrnii-CCMP3373.AAC.3